MARRHIYNPLHIFDAEPDQQWNLVHAEDPYIHFGRSTAAESSPNFHPVENIPVNQTHHVSPWNGRLGGYSSSTPMVNALPHYCAETYDPCGDSIHPAAAGNVFMVPGNHVYYQSSSNYGVENNFDFSMRNGRGPHKRKSPGIPPSAERGSTSRYFCPGSSSDVCTSSELSQDKSTVDANHDQWESLAAPASYRPNQLSIGGEPSLRNVRSQSTLDLEPDVYRPHLPANYSSHSSSSRLPIDHPGPVDPNQTGSLPLREWTPVHVSDASISRTIGSSTLSHESNHFFSGSSIASSSGEMAGYHHEHISSRNSLSRSFHPTPSHTRGIRSSNSHRSTPNSRVPMSNLHMSHVGPSDDGLQFGENHFTRHPRHVGPVRSRNVDRSGRSRISSVRYRLLSEDAGAAHDRLTPERLMIVGHSPIYSSRNYLDQHRDMMLDVDNMSYEELLALGERIGSVNIGLREEQLPTCLTETVYCSSDQVQEGGRCVICLEDYRHMDDVGTLNSCGHDYHVTCIKKWLSMKNTCPFCKGSALPDSVKAK